jgi:hypothetical protein
MPYFEKNTETIPSKYNKYVYNMFEMQQYLINILVIKQNVIMTI